MHRIRIIKRVYPSKQEAFIIQVEKNFIFWKQWVDAGHPSDYGTELYSSLEKAKKDLYRYDGTQNTEEVVYSCSSKGTSQ